MIFFSLPKKEGRVSPKLVFALARTRIYGEYVSREKASFLFIVSQEHKKCGWGYKSLMNICIFLKS